ncbi:MAG: hypothetical protein KJ703_04295, partial [Alphaproteobacteria bacterium]|nr:hypothetical protein [Alphaproteobacteria bacterium]
FFADYYAYISGGGDPAGFAGLPAYVDYAAALETYYAFLAGGGNPSAYTALSQTQIETYIAALRTSDVLDDYFAAGIATFLSDFGTYLAGGGDPDAFDGLAGIAPGGSSSPQLANAIFVVGRNNQQFGWSRSDVAIEADGQITSASRAGTNSNFLFDPATQQLVESGRFGDDVAWTRYQNAQNDPVTGSYANASTHIIAGTPAVNLPSGGIVRYRLVGGTAPTDIVAARGSTGYFTGDLAVKFGTIPAIGFDFAVTSGDRSFAVSTPGASANPAFGDPPLNTQTLQFDAGPLLKCTPDCGASVSGGLFGDGASFAGFQYSLWRASGQTFENYILGSAIFGTGGTALAGLGTPPPPPPPPPPSPPPAANYAGGFDASAANSNTAIAFTLTQAGFVIPVQASTPRYGGSNFGVTPNIHVVETSGALTRIEASNGATVIDRGDAENLDIAGGANQIIGRWSNGRIVDGRGGPNGFNTLSANQGLHYFVARGLTDPIAIASGRVEYTLAHATQPTLGSGRAEPGTFNANLAIEYGTAPKLGIDGTIVFAGANGFTYSFATTGGAAAPSKEIGFSEASAAGRGGFFSFATDTGSTDTGLDGLLRANGSLGDTAGRELAFSYTVDLVPRTGFQGESIAGAALFTGTSHYNYNPYQGITPAIGMVRDNTARAPQIEPDLRAQPLPGIAIAGSMAIPMPWDRWGAPDAMPGPYGPGSAHAIQPTVPQIDRLRARAETMLGGLVTYDK